MIPTRLRSLALVLVVSAAAACDDDVTGPQTPADVTFDASLGVDLSAMTRLESGVYIQTLVEGAGTAASEGDVAVVDYTLWLANGTEIDSGTDASFPLLPGSVIDGFRIGVVGMRPGETRLIVIPSALGYGGRGRDRIPPHSVLVFRVSLDALNPE